jgi:hypothetical protein
LRIRVRHDDSGRSSGDDPDMETTRTTRLCTLEATVGKTESCPEDRCPFWEPGGAALGGRCAFEELGITADEALASWLLEIRERLDSARSTAEADEVRRLFSHLLNESAE